MTPVRSVARASALALLVLALGPAAAWGQGEPPITQEERAGLRLDPDSLRHPLLGFAMPSPGQGYAVNPEAQAVFDQQFRAVPSIAAWALSNDRGTLLLVVSRFPGIDEAGFGQFAEGFKRGYYDASRGEVTAESIHWTPAAADYRLSVVHSSGVPLGIRCTTRPAAGTPLVVCAVTVGSDALLAQALAGLALETR